ncbi:MAG: SpoIVB peptidase [Ruminococcaceae bacterium]|nr:SpoIVB peptidase [Oscillospiraceae bacterium]
MKNASKLFLIINLLLLMISPTMISAESENTTDKRIVIPGGEAFGIKMFSKGLIVTKIEGFESEGLNVCPAKIAGIEVNDIIVSANEEVLNSSKEFKEIIEKNNGQAIEIKLMRDNKEISTTLVPQKDSNSNYKAGMWIKDSAAGLGTISFYSQEHESFCGLGHGICDLDTGKLMPIDFGEVESATITSVTKSSCGKVGTLNGYFTNEMIGTAEHNCDIGIYGEAEYIPDDKTPIKIANKDEVEKGKAYILTTVEGNRCEKFDIKIKKIKRNTEDTNMVIEITDDNLLNCAGGIVQGMSGSPIIQNNKLVGVITHVLIDDVKTGYAIFAETMYEKMITCE